MAKSNSSNPENNYSGIFGNKVYLKSHGGKSEMTMPVKRPEREPTEAQMKVRNDFLRAVNYAQTVLQDPVTSAYYTARETKNHSAYIIAVSDFLKPPTVDGIDTRGYSGKAGDRILVEAHDTVAVTGVNIEITDRNGVVVESGPCVNNPRVGYWEYTATIAVPSTAGYSVTATAVDIPNHPTALTIGL